MNPRILFFLAFQLCMGKALFAQQTDDCNQPRRTVDSLVVLAKAYAKDKKYISSDSYFKGAREWQDAHPGCFPESLIPDEEALYVVAPSTYQKLLEDVLALQENNRYDEALERYHVAGAYFLQYEVATSGLSHLSVEDFLFAYGKGGFVRHYIDKVNAQGKYADVLALYCRMLDKGVNPDDIKRPLYDLGKNLGMKDASEANAAPVKQVLAAYIKDRKDLKYFEMGYRFGRKSAK